MGTDCKYNGGNNYSPQVCALREKGAELVPVCPEMLGGLPCPRKPGEIVNGVVRNKDGTSVDTQYRKGAESALAIAKREHVDYAILQSRSPSCGVKEIYDGTFSRTLIPGKGVFARLLADNGIEAIDSEDFINKT